MLRGFSDDAPSDAAAFEAVRSASGSADDDALAEALPQREDAALARSRSASASSDGDAPGKPLDAPELGRFRTVSLGDASPKRVRPFEVEGPSAPSRYAYLLAFVAALNSANLGYDIGVMSGAALYVQEDWDLTDVQVEILVGILNGCAIGGAAVAHYVIDHLGRRRTFTCSCVVFVFGVVGMAASQTFTDLLFFRVVTGVGVGVGLSVDPVYIAEVAPKEFRGSLVSWSEISINVGILLGFVATFCFRDLRPGVAWRAMLGCGAVMPSVLFVLTLTVMPETPRWLVLKGRDDEARAILRKLTGSDGDLEEIRDAVARERDAAAGWRAVLRPETAGAKRALLTGVGVAFAQQILAEESLLFYQPRILLDMGMDRTTVLAALIVTGVLKTGCIVIAAYYLDTLGRRPLLLVSLAGMGAALFLLGVAFAASSGLLAILCVNAYMMAFSLGIGPVTWLLASEVFPLNIRAKAMTLATVANRLTSTVVASTFLSWARAFTYAGYFFFFSFIAAATFLVVHRHLPETKGKSLEEMAAFFERIGEPDVPDAAATVENPVRREAR